MFLSEVLGAGPTQAPLQLFPALSLTQWVKNPPAMQETQETRVRIPGREDLLEASTSTHSSILEWRIPWARGAWRAAVHRVPKSWTRLKRLSMHARVGRDKLGNHQHVDETG